MNKPTTGKLIIILLAFIIYSSSSIFSKYASLHDFLSLEYLCFFACVLFSLGVYAILWQKVLSYMELNKAFLCKSITILFILAFSVLLFDETLTINNLIGAVFIIIGLIFLAWKR